MEIQKNKTICAQKIKILEIVPSHIIFLQFISISLKGGDLTLFIILPDEINGLSKLIQKFRSSNAEVFTQISPFQEYKCVELHLPLGEILTQLDITKALKAV